MLLMQHIDDSLTILDRIGASDRAKEAFCIHPIVQSTSELEKAVTQDSILCKYTLDTRSLLLAMEYRAVANAYLSDRCINNKDVFKLSTLADVNDMLVADKVQNRKDFIKYHLGTHQNSYQLDIYFNNWLRKLGISELRYTMLTEGLHHHELES